MRVAQWSKQRLIDELRRGGTWRTEERDRVLARELLKRDLTDNDLRSALTGPNQDDDGAVFEAVVDANRVSGFLAPIREHLQRKVWHDGKTLSRDPFRCSGRFQEMKFTDVALEVLRKHFEADGAFGTRQPTAAHPRTTAR